MSLIAALSENPRTFHFLRKIPEFNYQQTKKKIRSYFDSHVPTLDLGCGTAEFCRCFEPESYLGVDISEKYISFAKKRCPQYSFIVASGEHLGVGSKSFPQVLINGAIHHLHDGLAGRLLNEAHRIMKSRGAGSPRLRILQIVDGFRMGGAENKLRELIARLDHSKYEIMLANVGPTGPLQAPFERLGIEMFDFRRRSAFDLLPFLKLYRLMRQRRVDIVQTTLFWADFIGATAAKLAGVPVILSWETVSHEGDPYHNNFQRRNGYRLAMKCVDLIIAVSHEVKESLIRRRHIPAKKIRVIHYGVDFEKFHPNGRDIVFAKRREIGVQPEHFLIGIIARLEPWKGHRYFLEAFAAIAPQFPEARAILVGDGSLRAELEQMTKEKNLEQRLSFLGVRKDVAQLVNSLDLLVLPSLPGEGLPNVLLEAMACGIPVIASRVGGVAELVHDRQNGYLVPPGDADALRTALVLALSDRVRLQETAKAGRATVEENFSLNQQIASFEQTYDELYAGRNS